MIHRFYLGFNILADYLHFAADILENVFFLQKYTTSLTLTRIPFSITILILNIDELESLIICTKYKNIYNIFILIHTAQHRVEDQKTQITFKIVSPLAGSPALTALATNDIIFQRGHSVTLSDSCAF